LYNFHDDKVKKLQEILRDEGGAHLDLPKHEYYVRLYREHVRTRGHVQKLFDELLEILPERYEKASRSCTDLPPDIFKE
jgi:hypothetical protein